MQPKPHLLYVSPVIPQITGNGLAMRAGTVLEALAETHLISLLVVRLYGGSEDRVPEPLKRLCRRTAIIRPSDPRRSTFSIHRLLTRYFGPLASYRRSHFDVVHVFRLATLPFVGAFLEGWPLRPKLHVDFDDIESNTHRLLADLCRLNGAAEKASFEEAQARRYEALEDAAFRQFDRIYICSEADKARLAARTRKDIRVLPNAVRIPGLPEPRYAGGGVFRFLFIGTLGYIANQDAALHLCRDIIPGLRQASPCMIDVDIVGDGVTDEVRRAAAAAGTHVRGWVREAQDCYRDADAVVVPLRAGGGTRIKILEAFSYRRPVVSTSIGAEGIGARDEEEILIADTPERFVQACVRLISESQLRERLTRNAFDLVVRSYSVEALRQIVAGF